MSVPKPPVSAAVLIERRRARLGAIWKARLDVEAGIDASEGDWKYVGNSALFYAYHAAYTRLSRFKLHTFIERNAVADSRRFPGSNVEAAALVRRHADCIERVTGDKLAAGQVVFNHGYPWRIDSVTRDTKPGMDRYYVRATNLDAAGPYARGGMELGLRVDLEWSRAIPQR